MDETKIDKIIELLEKIEKNTRPKKINRISGKKGTMTKEDFEAFYKEYPKKKGRAAGEKKFYTLDRNLLDRMYEALKEEKEKDITYVPFFSTWMNQERWKDEADESISGLAKYIKQETERWRTINNYKTEEPPQSKIDYWTKQFNND